MFELKNKDITVATFSIDTSQGASVFCDFKIIGKLPIGFTTMENFVNSRNVLLNRKYAASMMQVLGLTTPADFIDCTNCVSLFDSYWVKRADSSLKWENVSLYRMQNEFSEYLTHFTMSAEIAGEKKPHLSPEYHTNGSFDRCWMKQDGQIYLIKAGSNGFINAGLEPFSEVYVNQLEQALGIADYVKYELQHFKRRVPKTTKIVKEIVTRCDIVTNEDVGMIDALTLGITNYEDFVKACDEMEQKEKAVDMLLLDCLTVNTDRHMQNISFLTNNNTGEIIGPAPIYDNNMALLPRYMPEYDNIYEYSKDLLTAMDTTFDELFQLCLANTNKDLLKSRLLYIKKYFRFDYVPFNEKRFPESHLRILETFVKHRAGKFLEYVGCQEQSKSVCNKFQHMI